MVGIPLSIASIATFYVKIAELTANLFVDNPDYPSKAVGMWTAIGGFVLGTAVTIDYAFKYKDKHSPKVVQPLRLVANLSHRDERSGVTDVDPASDMVRDDIWDDLVLRIRDEPEL